MWVYLLKESVSGLCKLGYSRDVEARCRRLASPRCPEDRRLDLEIRAKWLLKDKISAEMAEMDLKACWREFAAGGEWVSLPVDTEEQASAPGGLRRIVETYRQRFRREPSQAR